ncbi:MAG: uracil-DNA glycosylase [Lysinibacillus sp.]
MKVNCFQCAYFKVTWEPATPRACTAYGFKTRAIPSTIVKQSSGIECLQYKPKRGEQK